MLDRLEDVSGSSGTGMVAEGVEFQDGTVVMRWLVLPFSTALYSCIADVSAIHGHGERTRILFLDLGPLAL